VRWHDSNREALLSRELQEEQARDSEGGPLATAVGQITERIEERSPYVNVFLQVMLSSSLTQFAGLPIQFNVA
jgi:hypothetical protein